MKIKEEIDKFKKQNGNVKYSVKELLYAIHGKIDKIEERLQVGGEDISSLKTWRAAYGLMFVLILAVLSYLVFGA